MTTYSAPRSISVQAYEPLTGDTTVVVAEFSTQITAYEHEILAFGGYWSARITLEDDQIDMEDWYERGLGRRIVTYSPDGVIIWEGVVNTIRLNLGGLAASIGPYLDVANKVRLVYSYIDTTQTLPVTGLRLTTDFASNTASQTRYGIFEKILSSGGATPTTADQIRDTYLAENTRPGRSQELSIGAGGGQSMELECIGVVQYLENYTYSSTTTGTQNASAKVQAVLDADPNSFIAQTFTFIDSNTLAVHAYDNDNRTAWNVIKETVALGDASDNRWLFGIYAGRLAYYQQMVEQTDYMQSLSDPGQKVYAPGGATIDPWYILPGKWLQVLDFMIGRIPDSTSLRDDPRYLFIESVTFRAPQQVMLRGGRVSRLEQKLARLGLAGIGA